MTVLKVVTPFPLFQSSSPVVFNINGKIKDGTPTRAEGEKTEYEIRYDLNVAFIEKVVECAKDAAEDI